MYLAQRPHDQFQQFLYVAFLVDRTVSERTPHANARSGSTGPRQLQARPRVSRETIEHDYGHANRTDQGLVAWLRQRPHTSAFALNSVRYRRCANTQMDSTNPLRRKPSCSSSYRCSDGLTEPALPRASATLERKNETNPAKLRGTLTEPHDETDLISQEKYGMLNAHCSRIAVHCGRRSRMRSELPARKFGPSIRDRANVGHRKKPPTLSWRLSRKEGSS